MIMRGLMFVLTMSAFCAMAETTPPCAQLEQQIERTYGFRPSQLSAAAQETKSKEMDAVWRAVEQEPETLVPCLEAALEKRRGDTWFQFDGVHLLTRVRPSEKNNRLLLEALQRVPLDDVDLRLWVALGSKLAVEGLDITSLGERWLSYPRAEYFVPEHAYEVDRGNGALFLFGALDERFATPALIRLAETAQGEQKEIAFWMLMSQATPEALRALSRLSTAGLSEQVVASVKALLDKPGLIEPRKRPRNTRSEFRSAFTALLEGNEMPFQRLIAAQPDGERDLVAVFTAEDLGLLRKVRRHYAARNSPHAIAYYNQFSQILMTMVWRREIFSEK